MASLRPYKLEVFSDEFVVQSYQHEGSELAISRSVDVGGDFAVATRVHAPHSQPASKTYEISAIFGIFRLLAGPYLAVVVRSQRVAGAGPRKGRFYKVCKAELIPFAKNSNLPKDQAQDEKRMIKAIARILNSGTFYFAENYDITLTAQEIATADKNAPTWARADKNFFYNAHLLQPLMNAGADEWIVPMMNGMVEVLPSQVIDSHEFDLVFISRRGCKRVGTRFNMRGLDEDGNAANYVETEQLLLHADGAISSYVQARGSIPVMWTQYVNLKYMPDSKLDSNATASQAAFERHANWMMTKYGHVQGVNLIDKNNKSGRQKDMGEAYDAAVKRLGSPNYQVEWFDFHANCRKMQWHNLSKLLVRVEAPFKAHRYFHQDASGNVVSRQTGVMRTNCMDNLDRTNVVQSLFARQFVLHAVGKAEAQKDVLSSPYAGFEKGFKNAWADHADVMSELYAGTGALKTSFTRTGKYTLAGKLQDGYRSVMRYLINNFDDGHRQDGWDLFMGCYTPDTSDPRPLIAARHFETPSSFFFKVALLMFTIAVVFAALLPVSVSWPQGVRIGMIVGCIVVGMLAFLQLKKGVGIGRRVVTQPHFVPHTKS